MQANLVLKQFEYILNVTEYVNKNCQRVKDKFLKAIDYVENMNLDTTSPTDSPSQQKQNSEVRTSDYLIFQEKEYLVQQMIELVMWDPKGNNTRRVKRFIPLITSIGTAIGSLLNAGQIKKIKRNIAILQDATILQGQKIAELARYADLTAACVRLHDSHIYGLQYRMFIVEDGIKEMIDVSNFQIYTSYHVKIAQTILSCLQTGTVNIANNIDKIFEYLWIMTSHKAMSAVIPPMALRNLLLRIEDHMHSNPRLRLPYDPCYKVHNLPAIPPGQEVEATNEYFAIGKHGINVTLPTCEDSMSSSSFLPSTIK